MVLVYFFCRHSLPRACESIGRGREDEEREGGGGGDQGYHFIRAAMSKRRGASEEGSHRVSTGEEEEEEEGKALGQGWAARSPCGGDEGEMGRHGWWGDADLVAAVLSRVECARIKGMAATVCRAWCQALVQGVCWERTKLVVSDAASDGLGMLFATKGLEAWGDHVERLSVEFRRDRGGGSELLEWSLQGLARSLGKHCTSLRSLQVRFCPNYVRVLRNNHRREATEDLLRALEELGGLEKFGCNMFGTGVDDIARARALVGSMTSSLCAGCLQPDFFGEHLAACGEPGCGLGVHKDAWCHYVHDEVYFFLYCHDCGDAVCQTCWDDARDAPGPSKAVGAGRQCGVCGDVRIDCARGCVPVHDLHHDALGDEAAMWFKCQGSLPCPVVCRDCVQERPGCKGARCPQCNDGEERVCCA